MPCMYSLRMATEAQMCQGIGGAAHAAEQRISSALSAALAALRVLERSHDVPLDVLSPPLKELNTARQPPLLCAVLHPHSCASAWTGTGVRKSGTGSLGSCRMPCPSST